MSFFSFALKKGTLFRRLFLWCRIVYLAFPKKIRQRSVNFCGGLNEIILYRMFKNTRALSDVFCIEKCIYIYSWSENRMNSFYLHQNHRLILCLNHLIFMLTIPFSKSRIISTKLTKFHENLKQFLQIN